MPPSAKSPSATSPAMSSWSNVPPLRWTRGLGGLWGAYLLLGRAPEWASVLRSAPHGRVALDPRRLLDRPPANVARPRVAVVLGRGLVVGHQPAAPPASA